MNKLQEIFEHKRREVEAFRKRVSIDVLRRAPEYGNARRPFLSALQQSLRRPALIAEVKRASPSQGVIREAFDPVEIADAYQRAGASCISVLTDERYFSGSGENLRAVRQAVEIPLLRKDFIFDEYQLEEARSLGADAVLLIAAMLDDARIKSLAAYAMELELDVLLEVHNEQEAQRAVNLQAPLVGINNRNLVTFEVDRSVTERLAPMLRNGALVVSESGLSSADAVAKVAQAGADAVLIGTAFCGSANVEDAVHRIWREGTS